MTTRDRLFKDARTITEMFAMYGPLGRVFTAAHGESILLLQAAVKQALEDERVQNTTVIRERLEWWQEDAAEYISHQRQLAARKAAQG